MPNRHLPKQNAMLRGLRDEREHRADLEMGYVDDDALRAMGILVDAPHTLVFGADWDEALAALDAILAQEEAARLLVLGQQTAHAQQEHAEFHRRLQLSEPLRHFVNAFVRRMEMRGQVLPIELRSAIGQALQTFKDMRTRTFGPTTEVEVRRDFLEALHLSTISFIKYFPLETLKLETDANTVEIARLMLAAGGTCAVDSGNGSAMSQLRAFDEMKKFWSVFPI